MDYHFNFERTAADYHAEQKRAHIYRGQLHSQIDSAGSAAEAEVRRSARPSTKAVPELLEYEAAKAAKEARSRKRYELTRGTGNIYTDLMNEEALTREVSIDGPPPRPSSNWLLALLVPPLAVALIATLVPPLVFAALQTTTGRALIAATILWLLLVLAWGFIFEWDSHFQREQYVGLLVLPPLLTPVGVRLWQWVRARA